MYYKYVWALLLRHYMYSESHLNCKANAVNE